MFVKIILAHPSLADTSRGKGNARENIPPRENKVLLFPKAVVLKH